jgi:F-type H+-transporting ATPase subunit delta
VISAQPLSKKQLESILKKLDNYVPQGAKINMEQQVDASLLGGFTVEIGDYQQDLSVRSQIDRLSTELLEVADRA